MGRLTAAREWWRKTNATIEERGARPDPRAAELGPQLDAKVAKETTGRARRALSSVEVAALAGVACAVQIGLTYYLLQRQPAASSSDAELRAWFGDAGNRRAVLVGLNLAPLGAICFLWFIAVIRRRLGEREDRFFATAFLGTGLAFALLTLASAVAAAAPTLLVEYGDQASPDRDTVALAHGLWFGLFVICASRFAAVFMVVTSTVGLRFGAFPRWLGLLGYGLAAVLFVTGAFSGPLAFLFPAWLLVVSVTLLLTRRVLDRKASSTTSASTR